MDQRLERILPRVQKPARYTGGEYRQIIKDKAEVDLRLAFCFPDIYEIGMSNIGMRILYATMNQMPGVWCERVFAPWGDMEQEMRKAGIPLYALESGDPVSDFDVVAFSLGYEMAYPAVLNMLDLAGIPLRSADRPELTPLFFAANRQVVGTFAVADVLKSTSRAAVRALESMGIEVTLLTGDNKKTAQTIASELGVREVIAEVLPQDKERIVREKQAAGRRVAMIGDGINDAPALARADVGIAIGAGTDVAISSADVVLMKSDLMDAVDAIRLSRQTIRNIRQNLFWAFFYNCIGIPLAAGMFISALGWKLNPMFGAAAMSLSSFCVVTNALRLNFFDMYSSKHDVKKRHKAVKQEEKTMTKTLKIEGMMCGHCEARVKKTLEAIDGVESAEVSHVSGTAVVTLSKDVADDVMKSAVEAQDYKVLGIE